MLKTYRVTRNGRFDKAIDLLKYKRPVFRRSGRYEHCCHTVTFSKDDAVNAAEQLDKAKELDPDIIFGYVERLGSFKKQNVAKALSIAKNINNCSSRMMLRVLVFRISSLTVYRDIQRA